MPIHHLLPFWKPFHELLLDQNNQRSLPGDLQDGPNPVYPALCFSFWIIIVFEATELKELMTRKEILIELRPRIGEVLKPVGFTLCLSLRCESLMFKSVRAAFSQISTASVSAGRTCLSAPLLPSSGKVFKLKRCGAKVKRLSGHDNVLMLQWVSNE
ncbi:UDP-N-acetylglucosamine 1-carboxyvinyltransferase [Dissostichus eleginoides]|uniref:UDP-N-acetylglucosamine 1-carboxyvinyltransferase n=1 Tax=Dissostichus eleginoides TaxID=100907 RepID=A0AAD9CKG0_DISEL|nr:UDP-N-acetylglucosamine 1-carboxyvinyltransferase [Dissostichus eleginoides]